MENNNKNKINNDEYKEDINICIKFVKERITFDNYDISKIDINTKNKKYYKINVLYLDKKEKKQLFSEYIIEKGKNSYIFHYLSNKSFLYENNKDEKELKKENYNFSNIVKIFYDNEWLTISEKDVDNYIKKTFGNINNFFEILNKEYYYTYIIKDEKITFLSKGKINSLEQIYNDNIDNILYNEYYTLLYKRLNNINNNKDCKDGLDCINPKCIYKHPLDYNLDKAYKRYILNEKTQNPKFKSTYCKYEDDLCEKHEYNRCIFKHNDDAIE
jgi:hypothetical protein